MVSITGSGTTTVTGTYPSFNVASADQYVGTVTSVGGTGTVNGLTLTGTVTSSGNLTLGGTLTGVDLTTAVTGVLPTANGGTNLSSFTANGAVYATSTSALTTGTLPVASGGTGTTTSTGTGSVVLSTSPTFTTSIITPLVNGGTTASSTLTIQSTSGTGTSDAIIFKTASQAEAGRFTTKLFLEAVYSDKVVALGNSGTAATIDLTLGNVFTATLTGNCTFTLSNSNANSNRGSSFTLILTNDATPNRTVAWAGGSFKFPGGAATLSRTTTANAVDVWVFFTPDNGTTWYGNISMKDAKA